MHEAYILLGANMGDKLAMFANVRRMVEEEVGKVLAESSVYESAAWGFESEQSFYNQIFKIETSLSPEQLLDKLLELESRLGRVRSTSDKGYQSRTIDIDILLYDKLTINTERLSIPHPRLHLRMFTLVPLAELAGDYVHPKFHKSIMELLKESEDKVSVKKVNRTE